MLSDAGCWRLAVDVRPMALMSQIDAWTGSSSRLTSGPRMRYSEIVGIFARRIRLFGRRCLVRSTVTIGPRL